MLSERSYWDNAPVVFMTKTKETMPMSDSALKICSEILGLGGFLATNARMQTWYGNRHLVHSLSITPTSPQHDLPERHLSREKEIHDTLYSGMLWTDAGHNLGRFGPIIEAGNWDEVMSHIHSHLNLFETCRKWANENRSHEVTHWNEAIKMLTHIAVLAQSCQKI